MIQELNPAKLALLYRRQFELCKVKKGETIVAVSDLATRREYLQAAFAAADDLGADIYELCVNSLPSSSLLRCRESWRRWRGSTG